MSSEKEIMKLEYFSKQLFYMRVSKIENFKTILWSFALQKIKNKRGQSITIYCNFILL